MAGAEEPPLQQLKLRDGRALAFAVYGSELTTEQAVVLYFHGAPSCSMEAAALEQDAQRLGLPVVAMDRAGIGLSDAHGSCSVQSVAEDAEELARHLALERVLAVGCSGGGPYAAAYASLFPERVEALALVSALGSTDWAHLPLLGAMQGADFLQLLLVRLPPMGALWGLHATLAYMAKSHPDKLLQYAPEGMAAADAEVLRGDERVKEAFARCLQHAYRRGSRGMAQDVRVLGGAWSSAIDWSRIQCRVMIWQGEDDKSVPVAHARWWHTKLPAAQLNVLPGEGHVTVLLRHAGPILEAALHWRPPLPGQHGDEPQQEQQEQAPPQQEQEQLVHS